jgi:AcrR family transcriptional regulator
LAGGRRKKNEAGPERRPAILDAAQRVLAEEGLKGATMRRIAAEADLSTAGLYIYFKNKEAILAAIRDRTFSELHVFTQKATAGAGNPEERLRRHLAAYLDFARSSPDGYRLTFRSQLIRAPRPGRPSTPRAAVGREDFTVLVEEIAELIQADGPADEMLAHALAETAWAVIHGVSSLVIDVPNFPTSGIDRCLNEAANMVLLGVRSHRRGQPDPT